MKTLKKSLCLILALVFVLGLCTFGAGAAFTDDADINYGDAVSVMQGLGILKGYEDGSFQPAKNVTRAEAAKMITYMILGEKYSEKLPAAKVFDDVAADHWAAKYINYCEGKGIIKGYGDGNFGPNDPVTGLQMAKMLLVACGYGEMGEFGPDNWEINTFTYAVENGIFSGVQTVDFEEAANREETAQYVFNTLWVTLVKYDVDMNAYDDMSYDKDGYNKINYANKVWNLASNVGIVVANQASGKDYTAIKMALFDPNEDDYLRNEYDLIVYNSKATNFNIETGANLIGHKVVVYWNTNDYKDADKNVFYNPYLVSDLSTVYTISSFFAPKSLGALAKEMGYPETDFRGVHYFANGVEAGSLYGAMSTATFGAAPITYFKGVYNLDDDTVITSLSGKTNAAHEYLDTTKVEIANGKSDTDSSYLPVDALIVDDEGEILSATKASYGYGQVTAVDEEDGTVDFDYVVPSQFAYTKVAKTALLEDCYEGIAKDDYVIVNWVGKVFSLEATSTKTMEVTQIDTSFLTTFNGSLYADSQAYLTMDDKDGTWIEFTPFLTPSAIQVGQTIKFYIGKNGLAFDAVKIDDANYNYVYVTGTYGSAASSYGTPVTSYYAQAVDEEGAEVNLLIGYQKGSVSFGKTAGLTDYPAGVYKATDTTDPTTGMAYVELTAAIPFLIPGYENYNGSEVIGTYKGTEAHIKGINHYLTSSTQYFYITGSGDTLKIKEGSKLNGEFGVTAANSTRAFYTVAKNSDGSANVTTVWVIGEEQAVYSGDYIFAKIDTKASGTTYVNGKTYSYYSAYINGVPTSIKLGNPTVAPDGKLGGFYTYYVDVDGIYTLSKAADDTAGKKIYQQTSKKLNAVYGDALLIAGVAEDVKLDDITIVDLTNGYQNTKGYSFALTDAESLAEALELKYNVEFSFMYDEDSGLPIDTLYVVKCEKPAV